MNPPPAYSAVVGTPSPGGMASATSPVTGFCNTADTRVEVIDPVEQGEGLNTYVTYKVVTTSSNNVRFPGGGRVEVIRRFRDFAFLRGQLVDKHPGVIIPPLPDKSVKMKMNQLYSPDDLKKRQKALQVFINRVVQNGTVGGTTEVTSFLEFEEQKWLEYYNTYTVRNRGADAEKTGRMLMQSFNDLKHSAVNLLQGKSDDAEEPGEYLTIKRYYQELERHLKDVYSSAKGVVAKDDLLNVALANFCESTRGLSNVEKGTLKEAFERMTQRTEKICNLNLASSAQAASGFQAPLKEYVRYMEAVRGVMSSRSSAFSRMQQAQAALDKRKAKVEKYKAASSTLPKVPEAEARVAECSEALEATKTEYDAIVARMGSELSAFTAERGAEVGGVLQSYALLMAQRHCESASHWQGLVGELRTLLPQAAQQAT